MSVAATLSVIVNAQTGSAMAKLRALDAQTKKTGRGATGAGTAMDRAFGRRGAMAAQAGLAAVAYGLYKSVQVGMKFESQMSSLGAVSGATGRQMEKLKQQALDMGNATTFSATEAAAAQTELAKGGLRVKQIIGGALPAALNLAAAGEMDLAQAATTTVNAMKLFGLRGRDAGQVADMLATAANTTTADVDDFAMALTQGGSAAKQAGLSLNDTVTILEALAESGVKNSDAGTSMKTALLQLIAPTDKQAKLTKQLGLSFISQNGEIKNAVGLAKELQTGLGGMSKAQRTANLKALAGTDGFRTLAALYDLGADKARSFKKANLEQGTAAETAAKKTDNLAGDIERLKGSLETQGIRIFDDLEPTLRTATQQIDSFLSNPDLDLGKALSNAFKGSAFGYGFSEPAKQIRGAIMDPLAESFSQTTDWVNKLESGSIAAFTLSNGLAIGADQIKLLHQGMNGFVDLTKEERQQLQGLVSALPTQQMKAFFDSAKGEGVGKAVNQLKKVAGQKIATQIGLEGDAWVTRRLGAISKQASKIGSSKQVLKILASTDSPMQKLKQLQAYLDKLKGKNVDVKANDHASPTIRTVNAMLNSLRDKTVNLTTNHYDNYIGAGGSARQASGSSSFKGGPAIVNEYGPEMARSGDRMWMLGGGKHGPQFEPYIPPGTEIFRADETRKLLRTGMIPSFASGKKAARIAKKAKKIAAPIKKATGGAEKSIERLEELVEIATREAAYPGSPSGSELSSKERTDLIGLNENLLAGIRAKIAALKGVIAKKVPGGKKGADAREAKKSAADVLKELQGVTGKGGKLLAVQEVLNQLNNPDSSSSSSGAASGLADANAQLAQLWAQRFAVSQSQYKVFQGGLPPFAGTFHNGGVVPGPANQERMALVRGQETISPAGSGAVIIIEKGAGVDESKIRYLAGDEANRALRQTARRGGRMLPSGGGG